MLSMTTTAMSAAKAHSTARVPMPRLRAQSALTLVSSMLLCSVSHTTATTASTPASSAMSDSATPSTSPTSMPS